MIEVLGISRLWPNIWWPLMVAVFLAGALILGLATRRPATQAAGAEPTEHDE
jgi:hypothetical protein